MSNRKKTATMSKRFGMPPALFSIEQRYPKESPMSELALLGGKKAKTKPFPLWPHFDDAERKALNDVLESRVWWRTPGTKTLEFEQAFARFHGSRHGIAVTNGTAALEVTVIARTRERMAQQAYWNVWCGRYIQLPIQQADDCRRGWHDHLQR